jgi:hypothetical protein
MSGLPDARARPDPATVLTLADRSSKLTERVPRTDQDGIPEVPTPLPQVDIYEQKLQAILVITGE